MSRIVLVIDTSTPAVLAALIRRRDDGRIEPITERVTVDAHAHVESLTPNVVAAVADAQLVMSDINAVVVGCGPGPFTGLRVGMSTAAAYGHALGVPVHGVCSLDGIGGQTAGEVLVITDARRREVYWARYSGGMRIEGPAVNAPDDVPSSGVQRRIEFAHPGAVGLVAAVEDWDGQPQPLIPLYLRRPDAKTLAERGLEVGRP